MTDTTYTVTAAELRQFIERYEHLEADKKDITDQQKEVMAEAKGRGHCVQTLKRVISLRKLSPEEKDEAERMLELYTSALGM